MMLDTDTIKIVIFGNSGSGKSTLANQYATNYSLAHLDLDILAWQNTNPPTRLPSDDSNKQINQFITKNSQWVIEGCYADLLSTAIHHASKIIFLNPGIETCIANCNNRPWEPHKYKSKALQTDNLTMLLEWVKQYSVRIDEFSLMSHQALFNSFDGSKKQYNSNDRTTKI